MTGAYLTTDGGESWRMFNLRGVVSAFAFDPNTASVLYAGCAMLWCSEDNGKSWRILLPDPAYPHKPPSRSSPMPAHTPSHPAPGSVSRRPEPPRIPSADAGTDHGAEYLYVTTSGPAGLYVSTDGGRSWQPSAARRCD